MVDAIMDRIDKKIRVSNVLEEWSREGKPLGYCYDKLEKIFCGEEENGKQ